MAKKKGLPPGLRKFLFAKTKTASSLLGQDGKSGPRSVTPSPRIPFKSKIDNPEKRLLGRFETKSRRYRKWK